LLKRYPERIAQSDLAQAAACEQLMTNNWETEFDDPIPLADGGQLLTLRDADEYIAQLPRSLYESERWQVAIRDLHRAVQTPAWRFLARLAIIKALSGKTPPE
jgi:hypothetical protein